MPFWENHQKRSATIQIFWSEMRCAFASLHGLAAMMLLVYFVVVFSSPSNLSFQQQQALHAQLYEQEQHQVKQLTLDIEVLQVDNALLKQELSLYQQRLDSRLAQSLTPFPTKRPTVLIPFPTRKPTNKPRTPQPTILTYPSNQNATFTPTTAQPTQLPTFYPIDVAALKKTRIVYKKKTRQPTIAEELEPAEDAEWEEWEEIPHGAKFFPYSNQTLAAKIERIKDFPKQNVTKFLLRLPKPTSPLSVNNGIHIVTTFFRGTYSMARVREILSTMVSNLENPYIAAVHVLWEVDDPRNYIPLSIAKRIPNFASRLVLTEVARQPTYREMFQYANDNLKRGAIAIVTNGDIYYDSSVGCVHTAATEDADGLPQHGVRRKVLALSRRHSPLCGNTPDHFNQYVQLHDLCLEYTEAHDSFVFAVPIPDAMLASVDHTQNVAYGAENVIIYEFRQANYSVFNYCHTVRGYHNHCVSDRHSSPHLKVSVSDDVDRHATCWPSGKRKLCTDIWVY